MKASKFDKKTARPAKTKRTPRYIGFRVNL